MTQIPAARRRAARRPSVALGIVLVSCLLAPSWALAEADELTLYAKKGDYADVRIELENAIVGRGLFVDFNGQVSKMLERTGADVGSTKPIYKQAEYFTFCSARLSRATMESDPSNVGFCPYVVFIYETATAPGTIIVGYRRPQSHGSARSKAALEAVGTLLDGIAKDAVK
ncbi:MAG: DUF302 domain-containing protein [Proteobacteria bacterium]|nr:DUF302 domain-containing protein [Pseudomonadota bacterium]